MYNSKTVIGEIVKNINYTDDEVSDLYNKDEYYPIRQYEELLCIVKKAFYNVENQIKKLEESQGIYSIYSYWFEDNTKKCNYIFNEARDIFKDKETIIQNQIHSLYNEKHGYQTAIKILEKDIKSLKEKEDANHNHYIINRFVK